MAIPKNCILKRRLITGIDSAYVLFKREPTKVKPVTQLPVVEEASQRQPAESIPLVTSSSMKIIKNVNIVRGDVKFKVTYLINHVYRWSSDASLSFISGNSNN